MEEASRAEPDTQEHASLEQERGVMLAEKSSSEDCEILEKEAGVKTGSNPTVEGGVWSSPPAYARPSHQVITPRLILRSARSCDAAPFVLMINDPLDSPYGGTKGPDQTLEQQLDFIKRSETTTAEGKNAWMTILLKKEYDVDSPTFFEVDDGIVIGTTGFNSFKTEPSLRDPSKMVIAGDIGAVIDHRYRRKGYAIEVLSAVLEYGFNELGCGQISMNTDQTNLPWRALMKSMGLDSVEILQTIPHPRHSGKTIDEAIYRLDRTIWDETKETLVRSGKWYLDDSSRFNEQ